MNYEEYEREVARRFANLRRAARRRALDRVLEIVGGLMTAAMIASLLCVMARLVSPRGLTRTADGGQLKQGE